MAPLLKSEIYAEINAHLVIQNKHILLNSLTGDSYFEFIYRSNLIEKICCLTISLVHLESFLKLVCTAKIGLLLAFVLKTLFYQPVLIVIGIF